MNVPALLTIAATEVRRLLRDRSNLFFVLLLPLLLVLFIGTGTTMGITVAVSGTGQAVGELRGALRDGGAFTEVVAVEEDRARVGVERATFAAAIIVPTDLERLLRVPSDGDEAPVVLEVIARDAGVAGAVARIVDAELQASTAASDAARLAAIVTGQVVDADLLRTARRVVDARGAAHDAVGDVAGGAIVVVSAVGGDPLAAEFAALGRFDLGASSQLVLFTFLTALTGAVGLLRTRALGIATRTRSTPTSLATILIGQALGRIAVAGAQAVYIVVATSLLFDVRWGDVWASGAVIALFAVVAGAFGMVVGTLARTEAQASGLGIGLGIGLGALGGSMVPLEVMPEGLARAALVTPHAWANRAFAQTIRRDGDVMDIVLELTVLAGFAVGALLLAILLLGRRLARA